MIPFRKSIGFRLLGVSFILLALPLLVDSFVLANKRYQHTIDDAKVHLIDISRVRQLPLTELQFVNRPLVEFLADYLKLEKNFPQEISEEMDAKLKKIAQIGGFYEVLLIKITPEGKYIIVGATDPQLLQRDYTPFFNLNNLATPAALEKGYESYVSIEDNTLRPLFVIARAVYSLKEERTIGVLAIADDVTEKLHALLAPDSRKYKINFALLLPSSLVFAATDPDLRFQYFLPLKPEYRELFIKHAPKTLHILPENPLPVSQEYTYPFFEFTWKGQEQIGYVKSPPGANFSLLTYASKSEVLQIPLLDFFNIYTIYGIILVTGGTLATLLTMRLVAPIQNLGVVMEKIQEGDLHTRYKQDLLGFEINILGQIFNEMVDAVLQQKHKAEQERVKREIYAKELKLGQEAQRSLLPKTMPDYQGVELAQIYIPAIEVGGDFFDAFVKEEGGKTKLVLAIADASGKGVQACFYSLSVRNMLRTYAKNLPDIAEAMSATNNLIRKDTEESGMFVTVLAAIYDQETKILSYYSCGHNPGLVRRENGFVEPLASKGMAMGVLPSQIGACDTIQLNRGDSVIFYTDGITEAHDEQFQFFGEERLIQCIEAQKEGSAYTIAQQIVDAVNRFVKKADQHDDITLLVMKIKND